MMSICGPLQLMIQHGYRIVCPIRVLVGILRWNFSPRHKVSTRTCGKPRSGAILLLSCKQSYKMATRFLSSIGEEEWASFSIPKSPRHDTHICQARIVAKRKIRSSIGQSDQRYVIETPMTMGPLTWMGQLTLANRQSMAFPILIGRRALRRGFLVDCSKRWILGAPKPRPPAPTPCPK